MTRNKERGGFKEISISETFSSYPQELNSLQVGCRYPKEKIFLRLAEIHKWGISYDRFQNWIASDYTETFDIDEERIVKIR